MAAWRVAVLGCLSNPQSVPALAGPGGLLDKADEPSFQWSRGGEKTSVDGVFRLVIELFERYWLTKCPNFLKESFCLELLA